MPVESPGSIISLSDIYKDLPQSDDVKEILEREGASKISDPDQRIDIFLNKKFIPKIEYLSKEHSPEKREQLLLGVKKILVDNFVPRYEDVPENYWKLQEKILLERGQGGDWESLEKETKDTLKRKQYETLAADQATNLMEWVTYFASPESNDLSLREKYLILRNILKLEDFNPETHSFNPRSKGTLKNYPELNREVIRKVVEDIKNPEEIKFGYDVRDEEKETYNSYKKTRNFPKMYSFITSRQKPISEELLRTTEGEWMKFDKVSSKDPKFQEKVHKLSDTVRLRSTGWCTAGYATAEKQLSAGDFYIYLSKDKKGNLTVPRLAIRMEGDCIAEVRGVNKRQEIDPHIGNILIEKLKQFPKGEGDIYIEKETNMQKLTEIHAKILVNPNTELSEDEIIFLYELKKDIHGFGYNKDLRIAECIDIRKKAQIVDLDNKVANKLIDTGNGDSVASNLEKFQGLNHIEVANKLIDAGNGEDVATNLGKFQELTLDIANKLIALNKEYRVAEYLEKFPGLDHIEAANKFIDSGNGDSVALNLEKFHGLDHVKIANKLIDVGRGDSVANNLKKFQELTPKIANKLIDVGRGDDVARNLERFQGINYVETANKIIDTVGGKRVALNLEKFRGLTSEIANKLIDIGREDRVAGNLKSFQELNLEIAIKLISKGYGNLVANDPERFEELDHITIANRIIEAGEGESVAKNLNRFQGLTPETANKLIETNNYYTIEYVAHNLERFPSLDYIETANKLIDTGNGKLVAMNLERFQGLNHIEIANKLIDTGEGESVANNLEKFQGLNHIEIANKLIDAGNSEGVARNLGNFQGLIPEIANKLIDAGYEREFIRNIRVFKKLNYIEIINRIIDAGIKSASVLVLLKVFKEQELTPRIAEALIDAGFAIEVHDNIEKFQELTPKIAYKLIDRGRGSDVIGNLEKFPGLKAGIELANKLIDAGSGSSVAYYLWKFRGLTPEIANKLIKIRPSYKTFVERNPNSFLREINS